MQADSLCVALAVRGGQILVSQAQEPVLPGFLTAPACVRKVRGSVGAIAQLGERLHGMQEVGGSIPPSSTKIEEIKDLRPHRLEA